MKLKNVVFLAGFSSRTLVYFQTMVANGVIPDQLVLFGSENSEEAGKIPKKIQRRIDGPRIDLTISQIEACEKAGCPYTVIRENSVNHSAIYETLVRIKPGLIIYSGYGSQIVGTPLLAVAPILHIHAGWLPEEKGSTTIYYSMLMNRYCSASAILLSKDLDQGKILERKKYPLPEPGIEIDHFYDNYIRADLLVNILQKYSESGKLPEPIVETGKGRMYYVIHPILKHIAILSTDIIFPEET